MRCSITGCPGEYEERFIIHTVRHHGQVVVFDHVLAEACSVCGDVLLRPETVRQMEEILNAATQPARAVPLRVRPDAPQSHAPAHTPISPTARRTIPSAASTSSRSTP